MLKNVANVSNTANNLSRREILKWLNALLICEIPKIDELCTGAAYCQLFHILRPDAINLRRVKFVTNLTTEYIQNFKLLQNAFTKHHVSKEIPIHLLIKGHFQDNLDFIQWFKKFYDANYNPSVPYDALEARGYLPIALCSSNEKKRMSLVSLNSSVTQLRNTDANDLTTQPALRRATTLGIYPMNFVKYSRKSVLIQAEEQNIIDACQEKLLKIVNRFIPKILTNIDVINGAKKILLPEDLLSGITTEERKAVEEFMAQSQDTIIYSADGQFHFDLSSVKRMYQAVAVPDKPLVQLEDFKDTPDAGTNTFCAQSQKTNENANDAQLDAEDTSARDELTLGMPEGDPNVRVTDALENVAPNMDNISELNPPISEANQLNASSNNQDDIDIKYPKSCIFINANVKAAGEETMVAIVAEKVSIDIRSNQNTTAIVSQQSIADVEETIDTNQDSEILEQNTKEVESSLKNNVAEELKQVVINATKKIELSEDNISTDTKLMFKATLSEIDFETKKYNMETKVNECKDTTNDNFKIATPRMNNLSICKVVPQIKYRAQITEIIEIEASCTEPLNFNGDSDNYNKSEDDDVLTTHRLAKPIKQETLIFEEAKAKDNVNLDEPNKWKTSLSVEAKQPKIESLETKSYDFKDFTQNSNDCQDNKPKTSIKASETYKCKTLLDEQKISNISNEEDGLLKESSGKWPNKSLNFNCLPAQDKNDNLTETDLDNFSKLDASLQEFKAEKERAGTDIDNSLLLYQTAIGYPNSPDFKPNFHSSIYLSDTSSPMLQYQKKDENQNLLSEAENTLNATEVKESSKDLLTELQNYNPFWSKMLLSDKFKLVLYTKEGKEKNTRLINYLKNCLEKICSSTEKLNDEKFFEKPEKKFKNSYLPKLAASNQQLTEGLDSHLDDEDFISESSESTINSDELKEGDDSPANVRVKKSKKRVKLFPLTGNNIPKECKKEFLRSMLGRKI